MKKSRRVVGSVAVCAGLAFSAIGFGTGTAGAMPPPPPGPGAPGAPGACVPLLPCVGPPVPPPPALGVPNFFGIPLLPPL